MTHYTSKARVAGHLCDRVEVARVESDLQAHARRCHRGLAPRVPRAHNDDIVFFGEVRQHGSNRAPKFHFNPNSSLRQSGRIEFG